MSKIFRIQTGIPFRRMRYAVVSLLIRADDQFYRNLHSALYKLGFRRVAYQFQTYGLPHSALWLMKPFLVCLSVRLSVCVHWKKKQTCSFPLLPAASMALPNTSANQSRKFTCMHATLWVIVSLVHWLAHFPARQHATDVIMYMELLIYRATSKVYPHLLHGF